jgi:hypothetical protein
MRTERRYLKRIGCQTFCTLSISGVVGARVLPHRRSGIAENVVPNPKLPLQHVVGGRLRVGAAVHGYLPRLSAEYPRDYQPTRRSTFATACGAHFPPRAVPMPRPLSAAAICRSVFAPAAFASRMAGATLSAKASAPAEWFASAIVWVAVWPQWWDSDHSRAAWRKGQIGAFAAVPGRSLYGRVAPIAGIGWRNGNLPESPRSGHPTASRENFWLMRRQSRWTNSTSHPIVRR